MFSIGIGSKTSTGGEVIEGNSGVMMNNMVASSVGHRATCKSGRKGCRGVGPIVAVGPRDANLPAGPAARIGDYVDCGCPVGSNVLVGSSGVSLGVYTAASMSPLAATPQMTTSALQQVTGQSAVINTQAQSLTYRKIVRLGDFKFRGKYKSEQEFIKELGVIDKTVIIFGKRGLEHSVMTVQSDLADLLNHEVVHEHIFVIPPNSKLYNIGFSKTGLFHEQIRWQGYRGQSYTFDFIMYVISGNFDHKNFLNTIPGNWKASDYELMGTDVNNCQSYVSAVRKHIESTMKKEK